MSYSKQNREKQILHIKACGWNLQKGTDGLRGQNKKRDENERTDMYTEGVNRGPASTYRPHPV